MYDPAPARPKKTDFIRSRGGCAECRKRRRKCDEVKPSCTRCTRSGRACEYSNVEVKFRDASTWAAHKVKKVRGNRVNIEANEAFFVNQRTETTIASSSFPSPPPSEELAGSGTIRITPTSPPSREWHSSSPTTPDIQWAPVAIERTDTCPFGIATPISLSAPPTRPTLEGGKSKEILVYYDHTLDDLTPQSGSYDSPYDAPHCPDTTLQQNKVYLERLQKVQDAIEEDVARHPKQGLSLGEVRILGKVIPIQSSRSLAAWTMGCSPTNHTLPCRTLGFYEQMYLQHFENLVVDILPLDPKVIKSIAKGTEVALAAAMALGAANMANLQGQFKEFWQAEEDVLWAPDHFHKVNALKLAGRALSSALQSPKQDASVLVAVNLLLSFVETTFGTFDGLRCYRGIVDKMVRKAFELSSPEENAVLVRGIADSQVFLRYVAGPWHTVTVPSNANRFLAPLGSRYCSEAVGLQQLAFEALATLQRTILIPVIQHSLRHPSSALDKLVKSRLPLLAPEYRAHKERLMSQEDIIPACQQSLGDLKVLSQRLAEYTIPNPLKDLGKIGALPELGSDFDGSGRPSQDLEPLHFKRHDEAMEAADFAFAQIVCDEALMWKSIQPDVSSSKGEDSRAPCNPWLRILLRIALGLDVAECIRRNIFRRGICTMLFHSLLRTNDLDILPVLSRFTHGMTARGSGWEDTEFPTKIFHQLLGSVERHLRSGRRILVLSKTLHRLYETSMILEYPDHDDIMICGFEEDGRFFEDNL